MDFNTITALKLPIARWLALASRRQLVWISLAVLGLAVPAAGADETVSERQARLEKMTVEQRLELERKRERFAAMPLQEQEKLRALHGELEASPNAAQLHETLARYTAWLNTLTSAQRAELLSMKCDERIARIKELMRQQEISRFRSFVEGNLPTEDRDAIYKWVIEYVTAHKDEIEKRIPGNERWRLRDAKDEAGRARMLAFWLQFQMRDPQHKLPAAAIEEIVPNLSLEAQQQISKAQSPEERQKRLEDLIRAAVLSHAVPRASDEDLRKFYAELPVEARARLEGLEGDELKNELRRMYNFTRFQRGGPWSGWGPGRGSGGPGGRREGDRGRGGPPRSDSPQHPEGPRRPDGPQPGAPRRQDDRREEERPPGERQPGPPPPDKRADAPPSAACTPVAGDAFEGAVARRERWQADFQVSCHGRSLLAPHTGLFFATQLATWKRSFCCFPLPRRALEIFWHLPRPQ